MRTEYGAIKFEYNEDFNTWKGIINVSDEDLNQMNSEELGLFDKYKTRGFITASNDVYAFYPSLGHSCYTRGELKAFSDFMQQLEDRRDTKIEEEIN